MCAQSTAKRRRKMAKMDKRYAPKAGISASKKDWLRKKAMAAGRSFGFQSK